jgi:hypothetical protein
MFTQQGQDDSRAVARALATHHSRATARILRPVRSALAAAAAAATALAAIAAFGGTAASAATVHPSHPGVAAHEVRAQLPGRNASGRLVVTGVTWHLLTLIHGWQSDQGQYDSGNPAWAVKNGIVYLSGSLHLPGGNPGSTSEFAVLPPAARPAHQQDMTVYTNGGTFGTLEIWANGEMYVQSPVVADGQAYSSLAGVSFPAATTTMHMLSLVNGWQGNVYGDGDPAYKVTGGVVHLTGDLHQPSGSNEEFAVLPAAARPARTLYLNVDTYGNTTGVLRIYPDGVMQAYQGNGQNVTSQDLTSLSGVSFPAALTATRPLSLLNGWQSSQSAYGTGDPSYTVTGGVVYLSGSVNQPSGTNEEFTVLPRAARPAHDLWIMTYTYDGAVGALEITTSGVVDAFNYSGNAAQQYTSLSAISYPVNS